MKNKDITYSIFQKQIKDKDTSVKSLLSRGLAICQSIFTWNNLPSTVPNKELERILLTNGNCFITKVNNNLYAFEGTTGGVLDEYNRPTVYTVANSYLNVYKNFDINKDGVFIENDTNGDSILPLLGKYSVLLTDALISLNTASILTRITMLISASDDKTRASAELFLNKIMNGDFTIVAESAFLNGVKMQSSQTQSASYISQLKELIQYYKASLYNELGLNANYNMKRERLNTEEASMNIDILLPYIDNMLLERQTAAALINAKYGTDISVSLNSTWKLSHENYFTLLNASKEQHSHKTVYEDEVFINEKDNINIPKDEVKDGKMENLDAAELEIEEDKRN